MARWFGVEWWQESAYEPVYLGSTLGNPSPS
jgi:hypothetical protein